MMTFLIQYVFLCVVAAAFLVVLWGPPKNDRTSTIVVIFLLSPAIIPLMGLSWFIDRMGDNRRGR